jgi:hypothetical protein
VLDAAGRRHFILARALPHRQPTNPTTVLPTVMKFNISAGCAALLCLAMVACYPYEDYEKRKKTTRGPQPQQQKTPEQIKTGQEDALRKKKQEETGQTAAQSDKPRETPGTPSTTGTDPGASTSSNPTPPAPVERRPDYPVANKVPGKDGFVFSPYNNKVVDVRDIPTGTLVQDPTYPASEKKYFRVP